jgi:hypothetical protein
MAAGLLSWFTNAPWLGYSGRVESDQYFRALFVFLTLFALMSVLERKILGRIQNRYGPNRVGPFGLLQPVADGIKMLIKEDIVPVRADQLVHFLAPVLIAAAAILVLGVIPYGRNMTPFTIDGGISSSLRLDRQRSSRCSWPVGEATTSSRCSAQCERSRK